MTLLPAKLAHLDDRIRTRLLELHDYGEFSDPHRRCADEIEGRLRRAGNRATALLKHRSLFHSFGAQLERDYEAMWILLSRSLDTIDPRIKSQGARARREGHKD